jgi:spore germination protein KC
MKRNIGMLFILIILLTLTGCWNRRELNDLAITEMIGFDKKGDQYEISAQVVNPGEVATKKGGGSKGAPVVTYSETGNTIFETFRKITARSPRNLYFSHLRVLVISEQLAREGIGKTIDFISRYHQFRTDFFIVVTKGESAKKILEIYTPPLEIIPGNNIHRALDVSSKYQAGSGKVTLDTLISDIISGKKQPVVAGIEVAGDKEREEMGTKENVDKIKPISHLLSVGLAVFKKDKLVGWLNEEESKSYNFIRDKVKNTVLDISCPKGGKLVVEIIRSKSKVKGNIINGKPEVNVELRLEANVADVECEIDLTKTKTIYELEKSSEKKLKDDLLRAINKAQKKYKADIFGFGEAIHCSSPKEWKKIKKSWDQEFVNVPVNVKVDVKIRRLGTVKDSYLKKLKE